MVQPKPLSLEVKMAIKNKYLFKFQFGVIGAWKSSANIKQGHVISQFRLVDNMIYRLSIEYCINV